MAEWGGHNLTNDISVLRIMQYSMSSLASELDRLGETNNWACILVSSSLQCHGLLHPTTCILAQLFFAVPQTPPPNHFYLCVYSLLHLMKVWNSLKGCISCSTFLCDICMARYINKQDVVNCNGRSSFYNTRGLSGDSGMSSCMPMSNPNIRISTVIR